ncbi:MAG: hypothetical protein ACQZ3N_01400 [cyanobacterium endosymbiont of Rhopalodia yunnanensis]
MNKWLFYPGFRPIADNPITSFQDITKIAPDTEVASSKKSFRRELNNLKTKVRLPDNSKYFQLN